MALYHNGVMQHEQAIYSFTVRNESSVGSLISQHDGWEILLGKGPGCCGMELDLRGKRYDLSKTMALVYNGLEDHHEFYQRPHLQINALVLQESFIDDLLGGYGRAKDFSFHDPVTTTTSLLHLSKSAHQLLRTHTLSQKESNSLAEAIAFEMIDSLRHNQAHLKLQPPSGILSRLLFKDILCLLHQNISTPNFNLDHMSKELGVTKFHLIRTAKKIGGITPHAYLLKIRLLKAQELLRQSKQPIADIAIQCGFEDLSSFGKAFRKQFGSSPSTYRA